MNEIESRRAANALARLRDGAPTLSSDELAEVAARARSAPVRAHRSRRWPAAALAAVVASAAVAAGAALRDDGAPQTTAGTSFVSFPEGSAVHLLTATADTARPR